MHTNLLTIFFLLLLFKCCSYRMIINQYQHSNNFYSLVIQIYLPVSFYPNTSCNPKEYSQHFNKTRCEISMPLVWSICHFRCNGYCAIWNSTIKHALEQYHICCSIANLLQGYSTENVEMNDVEICCSRQISLMKLPHLEC